MIPDKLVELIHKAVFDAITGKERGEIEDLLRKNPEARALYDDMAGMSGLLGKAPEVEPPAGLKKRILNIVEAKRREMVREDGLSKSNATRWKQKGGIVVADAQGRRPFSRRTGWLVGGGIAVVAIVLVIAFISQQPSEQSARGTIGGAEKAAKYRAGQIGDADVVLENPEFQELLQNDKVQDLVRSPEFQTLMNDEAFLALLNNEAFVTLMSDEAFLSLLGEAKLTDLMTSTTYAQAVKTNEAALAHAMSSEAFAELMGSEPGQVAAVLNDAAFAAFASNSAAVAKMNDMPKQALDIFRDRAVMKILLNDAYRALAATEPGLPALMSDPEFVQLMSEDSFRQLAMNAKSFGDLKAEPRFAQKMKQSQYTSLASEVKGAQLLKVLASEEFMALMSSDVYRQLGSEAKRFADAVTDPAVIAFLDTPKITAAMQDRPWKYMRLFSEGKAVVGMADAATLFKELADDPKFVALMDNPTYRQALASHQAQMAAMLMCSQCMRYFGSQGTSAQRLLNNPVLRQVMLSEDKLPVMMKDQTFMKIMAEPKLRQKFYDAMPKVAR